MDSQYDNSSSKRKKNLSKKFKKYPCPFKSYWNFTDDPYCFNFRNFEAENVGLVGEYFIFFIWIISIAITFVNKSYLDILAILNFPETELKAFQGLHLQGYFFIPFFGIPLVATIYFVYKSKRYYGST